MTFMALISPTFADSNADMDADTADTYLSALLLSKKPRLSHISEQERGLLCLTFNDTITGGNPCIYIIS